MKKNILILMVMLLLFTGCNKDEMSKVNNDNEVKVQDNVIDDKVQNVINNEEVLDDNTNEIVVEQAEEVTAKTTTTTTTTKKVTTKKTTKKTTTSKVTTTVKSETTTRKALEETETTTKKAEIIFKRPVDKGTGVDCYVNSNNIYKYRDTYIHTDYDIPIYPITDGEVVKIYNITNPISGRKSKRIVVKHNIKNKIMYSIYFYVVNPQVGIGQKVTVDTVIARTGYLVDENTGFHMFLSNDEYGNKAFSPNAYIKISNGSSPFMFTSR